MTVVLLVDDSVEDRCRARHFLASCATLEVHEAEDGLAALERLEILQPDVIVSDLHMPRMDGLQLVREVRLRDTLVPIVIITAHGSEEIAAQALRQGAAGYVPKSLLETALVEEVRRVADLAGTRRSKRRLMTSLASYEAKFCLPNDIHVVPALVEHVQLVVSDMKVLNETDRLRVSVALQESLFNAIVHGNLELQSEELKRAHDEEATSAHRNVLTIRSQEQPYCRRQVDVGIKIDDGGVAIRICDEGPGFRLDEVADPTDPANLTKECGRGLLLMRMFMDEVAFNDSGNQVTMLKRRAALPDDQRMLGQIVA